MTNFVNYVALVFMWLYIIKADDSFFELSTSNNVLKFLPEATVTIRCTVFKSRTGVSNGVQWYRRQGSFSMKIATEVMPSYSFADNSRYRFDIGAETSTTANYYLTITNLQLEDSSTIECGIPRFAQRASLAFAVCSYPGNESCDCMLTTGWPSPGCFDKLVTAKRDADKNRQSIIGLAIGLALVVILAICLTVWLVRNCVREMRLKQKEAEHQSPASTGAPPAPVSLPTPGASALKQPSQTGNTAMGGHSVRFTDSGGSRAVEPTSVGGGRAVEPASVGQTHSRGGNLYPRLDENSYGGLAVSSYNNDYYGQPSSERGYATPKEIYQYQPNGTPRGVVYGAPQLQTSYVPQPRNRAEEPETSFGKGAAFVDPGSTSV